MGCPNLGDYPVLDLWKLSSHKSALTGRREKASGKVYWARIAFLIGIVVAETAYGVLGCHASTAVHPTILGEMTRAESVFVKNSPVIDELKVVSLPNRHELFFTDGGTD
jgi:hypothetical protein